MTFKYQIVADLIKQKLFSGEYKPGKKLPSIKTLTKELSFNADTIIRAYKLLETQHLIYAVSKSGYYAVKSVEKVNKENEIIDMLTTCPPDDINPYKDFYHCMEKAIALYEKKLFSYSSPKGMPELIHVLVKHMATFQVFTKPDNIFITNGSQQALYILGAMSFPNAGSKVLVEQPTYSVMLQILKCTKTPVIGIKRTHDGIDMDELESIFKQGDIKFFYTMPRYQNPTGFSYSNTQKTEIIQLASKYGVYIVEDDYLSDLELDTKADPMYAMREQDLIIYIRSFSKALLPGLRLGMAILPEKLHNEFILYKRSMDLNTPILTQGALEIYLQSSMYQYHVNKTKKHYKKKMAVLRESCEQQLADIASFFVPSTGIFAYIETNGVSSDRLVNMLSKHGLLVSSTNNCYIDAFMHLEGLRLCTCKIESENIKKAVKLIKQQLECFSKKS